MRHHRAAARTPHGCRAAVAIVVAVLFWPTPADASTWAVSLAATSRGQAHSGAVPSTPLNVTATCVSASQQVLTLTWSASARATQYNIYYSTTSATGTYSTAATGITGTSDTSSSLPAGTYWFKVVAYTGANWASAQSAASAQRTIASGSCS